MFVAITWPMFENEIGQPISRVMVSAISADFICSWPSSAAMTSARSDGDMRGHGP